MGDKDASIALRRDIIVHCHRLEKDDVAAGGTTVKHTHAVEVDGYLRCAYCGELVPSW